MQEFIINSGEIYTIDGWKGSVSFPDDLLSMLVDGGKGGLATWRLLNLYIRLNFASRL